MAKKTDNSYLAEKLELRRYFLKKYHSAESPGLHEEPHVLDCCQGDGVIWEKLRKEFVLGSYWGVDIKRAKGRLKIDSSRILQQSGWPQNVIDIDTYGSPWKHWKALLSNVFQPITVFLTTGHVAHSGGTQLDSMALESMGLGSLKLPPAIQAKIAHISLNYCLAKACDYGIHIDEAVESVPNEHATCRYIGVRLVPSIPADVPQEMASTKVTTSTPPNRSRAPAGSQMAKEPAHV